MEHLADVWVRKAEAEFRTATRELEAHMDPNYEAVVWHAHQCALKLLRARLALDGVPFPATQHLVVLLEIATDLEPSWGIFREHLRAIHNAAQDLEDLEHEVSWDTAMESLHACRAFRDEALQSLPGATAP